MSTWNWALMALSGQCGSEMSVAGLDLAKSADHSKREDGSSLAASGERIDQVFQDDAAPVLKAYYEAQHS